MNKTYTQFSLQFKPFVSGWLWALAGGTLFITFLEWYFDTVELKDYNFLFACLIILPLIWIYTAKNVTEISEEGIKTYGLFTKEKFFRWQDIKSSGIVEYQFGYVKVMNTINEKKSHHLKVFLSTENPEKVTYNFVYKNTNTTRIPYRKDLYELILSKISHTNPANG